MSGSRKGIPNKIGAAVKSSVVDVFNRIGGREGMTAWALKNRSEFYKLYARLIPTESVAEITFRDASDLSDAELVAIATASRAGDSEASQGSAQPDGVH